MEKTIDEKLLSPTQSYSSFEDWEKDFTSNYLDKNPRKIQDDLMFDPHYNTIRNKIYSKFIDLKNGIAPTIETESDSSKAFWAARDALEKRLSVENAGKTADQIIMESMARTTRQIQVEKDAATQEVRERISALRSIYNVCNPRPSDRFRNN
jgi:hypothetical protein